jgi:hypothetical protein
MLWMPCPCCWVIWVVKITHSITCFFFSPVYGIPWCEINDEKHTHSHTLSEKLESLFFSLGYLRAISWTYYNKYFGKIFSALCVDVFQELLRIFPNFYIPWYMMKDSEVPLKNCLLIQTCSSSHCSCSMIGLVVRVFASYTGGQRSESPWLTFFCVAIKPRNIPKYIANN